LYISNILSSYDPVWKLSSERTIWSHLNAKQLLLCKKMRQSLIKVRLLVVSY